ncbi:MAG: PKD domain-containing protein [Chloroflexi bacterium]|nr:PKD domain-containing protein [Chloroflexota bacterium]
MKGSVRFVLGLLLIVGFVALRASWNTAAFDPADSFSGLAQIDGPIQLSMAVSPSISAPGDALTLAVRLHNQMKVTVNPTVLVQLPPGLRLDAGKMPVGMMVNLQTNELNWLPILPANGGEGQIEVALRVETADLTQPERAVTAVLRYEDVEQTVAATIWVGLPPQINRAASPPPVAVGQPVQLLAEVSGSGPITQSWELGDGRRVDVNNPVVAYAAAGEYTITLRAMNPLTVVRDTAVASSSVITVVPQPAAQFTPDDDTPGMGQLISFVNQSGGQQPLIYRWDFGDGTVSTDAAPTHQYAAPGAYVVHLVIENEFGQSEAFWPMTVGAPPIADMEIDTHAPAGEPISGQAFGDNTVTVFRWNMGDGTVHDGELLSYAYRQGGDFYVSMTAYNEHGGTEIGRWVHIDSGQLAVYLPLIMNGDEAANPLDPSGLVLDPVDLDGPFVMGPMELPEGLSGADQLFLYINEARAQFNLPPLNSIPELSGAAQGHVNDMIAYRYADHTGFDGSYPVERLLQHGYGAEYAGEATAWGFEHPYQAVEFWVNSPPHRRIILNQYATDVGVGYQVDYNAPNIWYWTAEFGNAFAAAAQPLIRLNGPNPESLLMISDAATFSWNWPLPLAPDQQFTVYRRQEDTAVPLGAVVQPQLDTRYSFTLPLNNDWTLVGDYEWQVVLEDGVGAPVVSSESRPIAFIPDPNLPTPTPVVTPTAVPTLVPTIAPITPTPTPHIPARTPVPTLLPPPIIVTATPSP